MPSRTSEVSRSQKPSGQITHRSSKHEHDARYAAHSFRTDANSHRRAVEGEVTATTLTLELQDGERVQKEGEHRSGREHVRCRNTMTSNDFRFTRSLA